MKICLNNNIVLFDFYKSSQDAVIYAAPIAQIVMDKLPILCVNETKGIINFFLSANEVMKITDEIVYICSYKKK